MSANQERMDSHHLLSPRSVVRGFEDWEIGIHDHDLTLIDEVFASTYVNHAWPPGTLIKLPIRRRLFRRFNRPRNLLNLKGFYAVPMQGTWL